MNEVGGNAAIYIDPDNPESSAVAVQRALEMIAGIRELSLANAARFKGSAMIDSYLSSYEKVCGGKSGRRTQIDESNRPVQFQEQL